MFIKIVGCVSWIYNTDVHAENVVKMAANLCKLPSKNSLNLASNKY